MGDQVCPECQGKLYPMMQSPIPGGPDKRYRHCTVCEWDGVLTTSEELRREAAAEAMVDRIEAQAASLGILPSPRAREAALSVAMKLVGDVDIPEVPATKEDLLQDALVAYQTQCATTLEWQDRAEAAEDQLARLEARIKEVIRRCEDNPQYQGTFPQVDRFGALLRDTDIMGKPWPKP
jgi:hypothetical protein